MKLLRGQEFFITSFIVTATAVVSVSLTKYDSSDVVGDILWRQFVMMTKLRSW